MVFEWIFSFHKKTSKSHILFPWKPSWVWMKKNDYDTKIFFCWPIAGCNGMSSVLVENLKNAFLAQKCTFDNFFHLISWFYHERFVLVLILHQILWPRPLPGFPMSQNISFFGHFWSQNLQIAINPSLWIFRPKDVGILLSSLYLKHKSENEKNLSFKLLDLPRS